MPQSESEGRLTGGDYITVKALENGVTVIGVTRGAENRFLHTEKLDEGEVLDRPVYRTYIGNEDKGLCHNID